MQTEISINVELAKKFFQIFPVLGLNSSLFVVMCTC